MGSVDLFHSRRARYIRCKYWIRDERDASGAPSEWVLYNQPSGIFYAKAISAKTTQMDAINGVWAVDRDYLTLETDDDVDGLSRGSIVDKNGELWIVDSNPQQKIHVKESEFSKHEHYLTIIPLRRA